MKCRCLLFLFFLLATRVGIAQIIGPSTGAVGVPVSFSSGKAGTDYNWSFDAASRNVNPSNYNPVAVHIGSLGLSTPSSAYMVFDGTNWFCFFTGIGNGQIRRADFGTDPTSATPTFTTLNVTLPASGTHNLNVVYDSAAGRWFGIATAQNAPGLIRLDFGAAGLTNASPTMITIPTNPATGTGHGQLVLLRDNGIWHCIQASNSASGGGMAYYNLGASLGALSASTAVDKVVQGGNEWVFSLYREGQEWFGIVSDDNSPTLRRLEFGASLQNIPAVVNLPLPAGTAVQLKRGTFCLISGCNDQVYGFIFSSGTVITKLDFGNSIRNTPTYTSLTGVGFSGGDPAFNVPSPFVYRDTVYMAYGNFNNNSLSMVRLMPLTGSTTTHHNSSVTHTFNMPGIYTVNLLVDPARQSGPSSYCTQITIGAGVLPRPGLFTLAPSPVCQGQNSVSYTVPAVNGATGYEWSYTGGTGVTLDSINTVSPANRLHFSGAAGSGTLHVRAVDGSSVSPYRDTAITVNAAPAMPGAFTTAPSSVCQGQNSVSYTVPVVSNATSYEWSYVGGGGVSFSSTSTTSSTNTADFSVSAGSGNVQVVATNSCGASTARSTAVTVNPLPAQPGAFTSAPTPVCNGQNNVNYSVPDIPSITYAWSYTGGTGVIVNGNGSSIMADFGATATNGVMEVTATNSCGTSVARTMPVTVNPMPQATVSPAGTVDICADDSATLTAGSGVGYSYEWKEGAAVVGQGAVFKAGASGSYKVIVTSANCSDSTPAVLVRHYSRPVVAIAPDDTSFCAGGMAVLNVLTSDTGLSYRWKDGTNTMPLATASFVQVNASGSYSVVAGRTSMPACADSSLSAAVTVYPLPAPGITWNGLDLYADTGYVLYQWFRGNGETITGATGSSYRPLTDGAYLVSVTDSNDCSGTSSVYNAKRVDIDAEAAFAVAIRIYPNPATSGINVEAPGKISVSVCSIEGKEILTVRDTLHASIDVRHLPEGLYILRIQDGEGKWIRSEKIIKRTSL